MTSTIDNRNPNFNPNPNPNPNPNSNSNLNPNPNLNLNLNPNPNNFGIRNNQNISSNYHLNHLNRMTDVFNLSIPEELPNITREDMIRGGASTSPDINNNLIIDTRFTTLLFEQLQALLNEIPKFPMPPLLNKENVQFKDKLIYNNVKKIIEASQFDYEQNHPNPQNPQNHPNPQNHQNHQNHPNHPNHPNSANVSPTTSSTQQSQSQPHQQYLQPQPQRISQELSSQPPITPSHGPTELMELSQSSSQITQPFSFPMSPQPPSPHLPSPLSPQLQYQHRSIV